LPNRNVGKIFKQFAPFFKMFTMYLNNYEHAINLKCSLCDTNAAFNEFVNHAQCDPRCKAMDLNSFLITPVQRVPRYKLLLEELLKKCPETEPDYKLLQEAFELTKESAKHNNEMIRQKEAADEMIAVLNSFIEGTKLKLENKEFDLVSPGRSFVKGGQLNKVSDRS